ncbi:MAG: kelch repeat-containing protein [Phycisphaerales bacterium]|nr:kelch repeat-containing protein [Phycisphaerales bacterium]
MKKALFLAIIFFIIATTACRKTNNSQTPNSLTNNFSVSVEVENNQLNLLAGEDTATILISITSSLPTSTYTLVASDTTIYNKNPVLPNNTIVSNAKPSITYMIGYTSKTPNPAKVLTFTVTDNNGKQELQNKTFNIRTGFVANVYPTSPSVFFGSTDSLIVNIKGSAGITGQYTISFSNDTVYYQSIKYQPDAPITLRNNLSDTLTYLAITGPTFNAGAKQLNFTVNLSSMPNDQTGNTTINLLNNSFMPVLTPKQTNIYRGSFDTVTVAINNSTNPNTTYFIKIDSAFIYKGVSYEGGSRVILQNLRGNNGLDSIVFQGRGLGAFNPTLTIKNLLVDSTATAQTQKLQLNVVGITLQSPANNAIDQPVQPIFVWNNTNPSIISYKVYYGTNQNNLVQDINNYTVNTNRSDTIRISPDGGTTSPYLSYATQYYWKVVGINASGAPVDSNSSSFTVRNALNLNEVRAHIGLAAYKDSLYAAGGDISNSTSDVRNDAEIFSQATDWKISPQILNAARYSFGLTAYKDSLYAVGGHGVNPGVLGSVEVFSPATGWNTSAQTLGTARQNFGLIAYRDTLFVIGGEGDNRLSSVETFYTGGSWVTSPKSLNANRSEFGVAVANDKIYVAGGLISNGTLNTTVESYDGMNWSNAEPTMKTARYTFGMTSYNNKVYAVGGKAAGNTLNSLEIFDGSSWQYGTPMPTAREAVNFIEYKGLLYAVGGINENSQFLSIVEIYNPTTNQWQ